MTKSEHQFLIESLQKCCEEVSRTCTELLTSGKGSDSGYVYKGVSKAYSGKSVSYKDKLVLDVAKLLANVELLMAVGYDSVVTVNNDTTITDFYREGLITDLLTAKSSGEVSGKVFGSKMTVKDDFNLGLGNGAHD